MKIKWSINAPLIIHFIIQQFDARSNDSASVIFPFIIEGIYSMIEFIEVTVFELLGTDTTESIIIRDI